MRDNPQLTDCGSPCVVGIFRLGLLCKRLEGAGEGGHVGGDRLRLTVCGGIQHHVAAGGQLRAGEAAADSPRPSVSPAGKHANLHRHVQRSCHHQQVRTHAGG